MSTPPPPRPQSQGPWHDTAAPTAVPAPTPAPATAATGFELEPNPSSVPASGPHHATPVGAADGRFSHRTYLLQKQFWKMFGGAFRFYDPAGNLVFYSKQKAFKLKEDIRLFTGEDMTQEVLTIQARKIFDFSATYDVTDAQSGIKVGALQRKGFKSMLQDEWLILDAQDREIGTIKEESTALAVIRRFIEYASFFLPQTFNGQVGNRPVCIFKQTFNPFLGQINLDFSMDAGGVLDRRLGIAAAVLLCAVEGKQR